MTYVFENSFQVVASKKVNESCGHFSQELYTSIHPFIQKNIYWELTMTQELPYVLEALWHCVSFS